MWSPAGTPTASFGLRSVFHPWLKNLLLYCFQGREIDQWRRNKTEQAFHISSPGQRLGRSRLSFKSGAYRRPVSEDGSPEFGHLPRRHSVIALRPAGPPDASATLTAR